MILHLFLHKQHNRGVQSSIFQVLDEHGTGVIPLSTLRALMEQNGGKGMYGLNEEEMKVFEDCVQHFQCPYDAHNATVFHELLNRRLYPKF